jgi:lipopolysaccharide/colanic/teichoic acid biosynthesis glycosyltransferase
MTAPAVQDVHYRGGPERHELGRMTEVLPVGGIALRRVGAHEATFDRRLVKRAFDIAVSALALVLTLPLFALIALAIVIESPGPVFYRAERVGRGHRLMRMLKFRKMRLAASGIKLTMGNDPRLTRVGTFLTRSKLDELPQLINVLRGEMSLIGPRPEDPAFVAQRRGDFGEILLVRPGITGYSQIAFAEESRILLDHDPVSHYLGRILPAKCALDRMYVRSVGLRTDMRILFWTAIAVALRRQVAVHRETGSMNLRRRPQPPGEERADTSAPRESGERHVVDSAASTQPVVAGDSVPPRHISRAPVGLPG